MNTSSRIRPRPASKQLLFASLLCLASLTTTTEAFIAVDKAVYSLNGIQQKIARQEQNGLFSLAVPADILKREDCFPESDSTIDFDFSSTFPSVAPTNTAVPAEEQVLEWATRYTSVEALRQTFGTNHNKLWGDLQASTARRLYKTLLPRALLELSKLGEGKIPAQDLAPLAFQARKAAKVYVRERSSVPARLAATLFDGFRQWMKYGRFQAKGMTYDQLWEKYAERIIKEAEAHLKEEQEECDISSYCQEHYDEISEQVSRKILERSCVTNAGVDSVCLDGKIKPAQKQLLEQIRVQLQSDMFELLLPQQKRPLEIITTTTATTTTEPTATNDMVEIPVATAQQTTARRPWIQNHGLRLIQNVVKRSNLWNLHGNTIPAAVPVQA